jgi:hypothetical protein
LIVNIKKINNFKKVKLIKSKANMKTIKIYLLPLILVLLFASNGFSQNKVDSVEKEKISKTDSILIHTYFTEEEYNKIHNIEKPEQEFYYSDEAYNEKENKHHREKDTIKGEIAAEIIVEVVVNTLFFIVAFWH